MLFLSHWTVIYLQAREYKRPKDYTEEYTSTVMDYINYHVDNVISRKLIRKSAQPTLVNSCATLAEELNYFDRDNRDQMVQPLLLNNAAPILSQHKVIRCLQNIKNEIKKHQKHLQSLPVLTVCPCIF